MSSDDTGLEKAATKTPAVITTPEEYRGAVLRWQEHHFNVLTPFANISALAPSHGIISSLVQIATDAADQEIYDSMPFLKKGEVAIAKRGLRKIAEGLGISTKLEYISVAVIRYYWHVKAIASYRGVDGATIEREASQEWDLRDGSDRLKGWTANQISEARKHGLRACETRAINAVIRECGCGVKQAYQREELTRPFVAVRVMFIPNENDPEQMRMVLDRALGSTNILYPASRTLPSVVGNGFEDHDDPPTGPRHVGSGSTQQSTAKAAAPDLDQPPCDGAVRIVKIEEKTGEKNGRAWVKWTVTDSNGLAASTFSRSVKDAAEAFLNSRAWVEMPVETSEDGRFHNVIEIVRAGEQPKLPDVDNL